MSFLNRPKSRRQNSRPFSSGSGNYGWGRTSLSCISPGREVGWMAQAPLYPKPPVSNLCPGPHNLTESGEGWRSRDTQVPRSHMTTQSGIRSFPWWLPTTLLLPPVCLNLIWSIMYLGILMCSVRPSVLWPWDNGTGHGLRGDRGIEVISHKTPLLPRTYQHALLSPVRDPCHAAPSL